MLSDLLSLLGEHQIELAYDGVKALEVARSKYFNLIILDLGMPGMGGYQVAAEIRKVPHLQKTRLAALTGWGSESHRNKTREAGFDKHLTKPVAIDDIKKLLAVPANS